MFSKKGGTASQNNFRSQRRQIRIMFACFKNILVRIIHHWQSLACATHLQTFQAKRFNEMFIHVLLPAFSFIIFVQIEPFLGKKNMQIHSNSTSRLIAEHSSQLFTPVSRFFILKSNAFTTMFRLDISGSNIFSVCDVQIVFLPLVRCVQLILFYTRRPTHGCDQVTITLRNHETSNQ